MNDKFSIALALIGQHGANKTISELIAMGLTMGQVNALVTDFELAVCEREVCNSSRKVTLTTDGKDLLNWMKQHLTNGW